MSFTMSLINRSAARTGRRVTDAVALPILIVAGLLAYWLLPEDLALLTRIAATALYILSLDLVLGVCGIATLGHAALFGAGAYAAGIAAVHWVQDPILLLLVGGVGGALVAALSGALILHAHGLTLLMLTIAVAQLLQALANKLRSVTGGSDGLSGIDPTPVLGLFRFDLYGKTSYLFALTVLILAYIVARRLLNSPFGLACRGVKEDPLRIAAMGGTPRHYLLTMYTISGVFAGIAGALTTVTTGVVGLDSLSFTWSAEAVVMLVLGGMGRLYGAIIGTLAFMGIHHILAATDPFHWMLFIGLFLIGVVLFAPGGLTDVTSKLAKLLSGRRE